MKAKVNKAKIARKYYPFLMLNVFKKKSVWAIFLLYLFALALYLYIVPTIMHQTPFLIWSQTVISVQSVISYISAIFSSLLILAIYKDFRDDGTELLIVSKPISREKMLLIKAAVYLSFCLIMSTAAMLLGLFVYCFDVPSSQQSGLIGSIFFVTLIFLVIFGAITMIVSIYFNKIWVILFSILLCAFSNIYYVVIKYANIVKTPTDAYLDKGDTQITTVNYLNADGSTYGHYANIVSEASATNAIQSIMIEQTPLKPYLESKADYDKKVADSNYVIANYFNVTSQINQMGNAFGLRQNVYDVSNKGFGWNRDVNYDITGNFAVERFNPNNVTYPLMFVDWSKLPWISETDASNLLALMSYVSDQNTIAAFFNEPVLTVGSSTSQVSSFSAMSIVMQGNDNYSFVITYPDSRGKVGLNPKDIKISNSEKLFFDTLLDSSSQIEFTKYGSTTTEYTLPSGLIYSQIHDDQKPFINVIDGVQKPTFINDKKSVVLSSPSFTLTDKDNTPIHFEDLTQYIHFALLSKIKTSSGQWQQLNITNNEQLMKTTLKFKYYILMNKYLQMQEKYLNPILNAYSEEHETTLNTKHFGAFVLPFDICPNPETGKNEPVANPMFYDPEYIGIATLVKNFSLTQDINGYAGTKTYKVDNKTYLDPMDFSLRKGGNTGNISINQDTILTANYMGFTFESVDQISTLGLYLFWSFFAVFAYAIAYVIYSRIDFK